ncbi:amidase 1-like [Pistacia vera]|uniref:amidase 1-like n=1 Tax=Pistacia vera TaxID=55513 RepID=UPI00126359BC|nr:amidase 1-like [Pistacia vera]
MVGDRSSILVMFERWDYGVEIWDWTIFSHVWFYWRDVYLYNDFAVYDNIKDKAELTIYCENNGSGSDGERHRLWSFRQKIYSPASKFDVEGYVTGFGHPERARTHSAATSTAPAVLAVLRGGATCIGKTVMDEMACSINGENIHYGTPTNLCAPDRIPGGSSSGSAIAVGAKLLDFSLGTDTGGSVRVPASYCGIYGFRPSSGAVSTAGVIPMSQFFDTVGWFARDPTILKQVGHVLLESSDTPHVRPGQVIVAED